MRLRFVIAGIAVASLCSVSAIANTPTARELAEGRRVLHDFASCIADQQAEISRNYVISDEYLPTDEAEAKKLVDSKCMLLNTGRLAMRPFFFRGALAERLIVKTLGPDALAHVELLAPLNMTVTAGNDASPTDVERAQTYTYVLRLSECIARAAPDPTAAVFATKMDSEEEQGALVALTPQIMACVPSGEKVAVNRTNLRMGLAIAYYRLADTLSRKGQA